MNDTILSAFVAGPIREAAPRASAQPETVFGEILPTDFALLLEEPNAEPASPVVAIMAQLAQPQASLPMTLPIANTSHLTSNLDVTSDTLSEQPQTGTPVQIVPDIAVANVDDAQDQPTTTDTLATDQSTPAQATLAPGLALDPRIIQVPQAKPELEPTPQVATELTQVSPTASSAIDVSAPKDDTEAITDPNAPKAAPVEIAKSAPAVEPLAAPKSQTAQATEIIPETNIAPIAQDSALLDDQRTIEPDEAPDDNPVRPLAQQAQATAQPPLTALAAAPMVQQPPRASQTTTAAERNAQPTVSAVTSALPRSATVEQALPTMPGAQPEHVTHRTAAFTLTSEPSRLADTPDATQVLRQIDAAVTRSDGGEIEVTLNPRELGRVSIRMDVAPNEARIIIAADRPETLSLLKSHQGELASSLANNGYSTIDMTFSDNPRQFNQAPPDEQAHLPTAPEDSVEIAPQPWPRARQITTSGHYDRRI